MMDWSCAAAAGEVTCIAGHCHPSLPIAPQSPAGGAGRQTGEKLGGPPLTAAPTPTSGLQARKCAGPREPAGPVTAASPTPSGRPGPPPPGHGAAPAAARRGQSGRERALRPGLEQTGRASDPQCPDPPRPKGHAGRLRVPSPGRQPLPPGRADAPHRGPAGADERRQPRRGTERSPRTEHSPPASPPLLSGSRTEAQARGPGGRGSAVARAPLIGRRGPRPAPRGPAPWKLRAHVGLRRPFGAVSRSDVSGAALRAGGANVCACAERSTGRTAALPGEKGGVT